jgi:hypothetical protein
VNRGARLAALLAALLLSACASTINAPTTGGDSLGGRLAVWIDASEGMPARSENAAFELLGGATTGRLNL